MGFYEHIRDNTASPLIEQYGFEMFVVRRTTGTHNDVTGFYSGVANNDLPVKGLYIEFDEQYGVDMSTVLVGDRLVMLAATEELQNDDKLRIGSDVWNIQKLGAIQPGNVVVAYILHLRK